MIETAEGKTFRSSRGNHREIIVGNENNSANFEPHIRIKSWGEECYLPLGLPTAKNFMANLKFDDELQREIVEWIDTDADRKYQFHELDASPGAMEFGGFEFKVWLATPPAEDFLDFQIPAHNLNLYPQSKSLLSERQIAAGSFMPDNVDGSIAAYHPTCGAVHAGAAKADKYRVGKAFHIMAPYVIDALGLRVKLPMLMVGGSLHVLLDRTLFASLTYPVCIDPDIGNTSLALTSDATGSYSLMNPFTASANGTTDAGTAYYGGTSAPSGSCVVKVAVYEFGDGNISGNARLAFSSDITLTSTVNQFVSAAITPPAFANGTQYFVGGWSNAAATITYADLTTGGNQYFGSTSSATPADPYPTRSGTQTITPSIYISYTEDAGGATAVKDVIGCGVVPFAR